MVEGLLGVIGGIVDSNCSMLANVSPSRDTGITILVILNMVHRLHTRVQYPWSVEGPKFQNQEGVIPENHVNSPDGVGGAGGASGAAGRGESDNVGPEACSRHGDLPSGGGHGRHGRGFGDFAR